MRRELRILLATLALGGAYAGGTRLLDVVSDMKLFRVSKVEVNGLDYASKADIVRLLGLTPETSVWSDPDVWAQRVMEHPLVEHAEVHRRMPGTVVVDVTERTPVALVPTPTLEPVDAEGNRLPIDPAERRMDLPVVEIPRDPAPGARLLPSRGRALVAEVARFQTADTTFLQRVSEVAWLDAHTVVARWSEPHVDFLFNPGEPARRLEEGLAVLADALGRDPEQAPTVIDLRYADQVVVRRTR